jgi:hypothetical protein
MKPEEGTCPRGDPEDHVRRSLVLVELAGLVTFASLLVLVLVAIPMLAAWVQVAR